MKCPECLKSCSNLESQCSNCSFIFDDTNTQISESKNLPAEEKLAVVINGSQAATPKESVRDSIFGHLFYLGCISGAIISLIQIFKNPKTSGIPLYIFNTVIGFIIFLWFIVIINVGELEHVKAKNEQNKAFIEVTGVTAFFILLVAGAFVLLRDLGSALASAPAWVVPLFLLYLLSRPKNHK